MENMVQYDQTLSEYHVGMRCNNADEHWIEVSPDFSFLGDKKSILILPGSGTNSAKEANGICKRVENMIPSELRDDYHICSLYYANSNTCRQPTVIRAEKLFNDYIVPLISTKDKNNDLHRIDSLKAAHNLRNLTIVTHCYGGYIMQEIDRLLDQTMADLAYSLAEIKFIHKQLFVVQHNNIDDELGKNDFGSSHLIRISQSDERVCYKDALNSSFCHYVGSSGFSDENLMYVRLSENIRVLLADRITKDGQKEHNGGYWLESCYKTQTGQKEEKVFQAIFKEIITTDSLIDDFEKVVRCALRKNKKLKEIFVPIMLKGRELEKGFKVYNRLINDNFEELKNKIIKHKINERDLTEQPSNVLLAEDKDGMFLMDYALQSQNYHAATLLADYMRKDVPRAPYLSRNRNQTDVRSNVVKWAQHALDNGKGEAFKAISGMLRDAQDFNYDKANAEVICTAAQVYSQYIFPDDQFTQDIYCRNLAAIYAKSKSFANIPEIQKACDIVTKIIFETYSGGFEYSAYAREQLKTYCSLFGAKELKARLEKKWPCIELPKDKTKKGVSR